MMFGQKVNIQTISTGHYCVNIQRSDNKSTYDENVIIIVDSNIEKNDKRNALLKFPNSICSCFTREIVKLSKTAGMVDQETTYLLKDIYKKYAICHKYTSPKMKPIVGFNPANDFKQIIALDLHELGPGLWYLHMIDLFSRLSMAVEICSKKVGVI